ncbi:UDP-glycosyltransferase [Asimina triloba]
MSTYIISKSGSTYLAIVVLTGILCRATPWNPDENLDALVTMEQVRQAVEKLMDEGEEGEERRKSVNYTLKR